MRSKPCHLGLVRVGRTSLEGLVRGNKRRQLKELVVMHVAHNCVSQDRIRVAKTTHILEYTNHLPDEGKTEDVNEAFN